MCASLWRGCAHPPCGIGTRGTTRPCAHRRKRQQSYESTQEPARSIATKTEIFFSIELSTAQNAGERSKTARPSQQTRELFSISSPTPLVAVSSNSFAPIAVRTHTPARVYAHSAVFRLLPSPFTTSPYSIQNVTIRSEGFAVVRSSPSSPEKRNLSHRLFSCKASSVRRLHRGELLPIFLLHGNLHPYLADYPKFTPYRLLKIG